MNLVPVFVGVVCMIGMSEWNYYKQKVANEALAKKYEGEANRIFLEYTNRINQPITTRTKSPEGMK